MTHTAHTRFAATIEIDTFIVEAEVSIAIAIEEDYSFEDGSEYPVPSVTETPVAEGSYVDSDIWFVEGDEEMCVGDGQMFRAAERAIIDFFVNTDEGAAMVRQAWEDDCVSQAEEHYERSLEARW